MIRVNLRISVRFNLAGVLDLVQRFAPMRNSARPYASWCNTGVACWWASAVTKWNAGPADPVARNRVCWQGGLLTIQTPQQPHKTMQNTAEPALCIATIDGGL